MRKDRMRQTLFIGVALVLVLGGGLFLALTGYGALTAYAQDATATPAGGIRTLITPGAAATATVAPATAVTATVAPTATETAVPVPVSGTVPEGIARSITVVGEGHVSVQPDMAQTTVGVEVITDTVKAGTTAVSNTMAALIKALEDQGVAEKDIQTSGYNISIERQPSPTGQAGAADVIRYHVSNNVVVIIRDLNKVGNVLDAAINAGANNIYGISFSLSNQNAVDHEAYSAAMSDANARAGYLAGLANVSLGPVISVSEVVGANPLPGVFAKSALGLGGGGVAVQPGELEVVRQLQVVYSIH